VRRLGSFVKTVHPDWVRPQFGETFIDFVDEYADRLRDRYGLDLRDQWPPVPEPQRPPTAGGSSGTDPRLGYVFYEKMSEGTKERLQASGLAEPDVADARWIGMHPRLARVYMTALADQLAGEQGLSPLTDDTVDHVSMGGCSVERLAHAVLEDVALLDSPRGTREVENVAAFLALEVVLPRAIESIPADDIMDFRSRYLGNRGAFQAYLSGFLEKRGWLRQIEDPATLAMRIKEEYEKDLKPKLAELRSKLAVAKIDTVPGVLLMQLGVPGMMGQVGVMAHVATNPAFAGIATATGTALALSKVVRDHRKGRREALTSSPVAYLMRVEENLAPATVVGWIKKQTRRIFGD
jgi:hypothetical protein